jgi:hypothetical protein
MMNARIRNVLHAILLGYGFFLIWALLLLPANWIYERLAIRAAFGQTSDSPPPVSVTSIKKHSTVTFSNGVVGDVGYVPAAVSSSFHIVAFVVGGGFYIYKFRRQIRLVLNGASPRVVTKRGGA